MITNQGLKHQAKEEIDRKEYLAIYRLFPFQNDMFFFEKKLEETQFFLKKTNFF